MREVVAVVSGVVAALVIVMVVSAILAQATGHALGASAFLLLALVVFPLGVATALRLARGRGDRPAPSTSED